jgi:hypothetical protein
MVEDPSNATLTFQYRQNWRWQPLDVGIWGHGITPWLETISSAPGSRLVRDVALTSGITLQVPLRKDLSGRRIWLERWNGATRRWGERGNRSIDADGPPSDERSVQIRDLAPGVYRFSEEDAHSRSFELGARPAVQSMPIDLGGGTLRVKGRVVVPPDVEPRHVVVVPLPADGSATLSNELARRDGVAVGYDGSFDLVLLATDRVRIVPWHPAVSPIAAEGRLVERGADPVELALGPPVRGARFTPPGLSSPFRSHASIRVLQLDEHDRLVAELEAVAVGDVFQFANARPGKGKLVIDPPSELVVTNQNEAPLVVRLPSLVPLTIEDVSLGDALVDLGAPAFKAGSALVLTFPDSWPRPLPVLEITVEALEAPAYVRRFTLASGEEARFDGLRKGSFRLTVVDRTQYSFRFVHILEADGENPVTVVVESPVAK